MAATADPRAKTPAAASTHHLEPWGHRQPPHARRMPIHPTVESAAGEDSTARDRRRSSSSSSSAQRRGSGGQVVGEETYDGGIEELRVKLMGHLRDAADRLCVSQPGPLLPPPPKADSPRPETEEHEPELRAPPPPPPPPTQQPEADVADRPWKLRERTRRRPAALTSWAAPPAPPSRRRKRPPFSLFLTPEEVEEDIYALTGGRPRRRPRKRPRVVQRQLDSLFPGLWLTEVTADAYKVPDD